MSDHQAAEEIQTQLLHRVAAQDRQALAEFYDQLAGVLFSTSLRIIGDPQEAEEVIQDVFVQIWEKAATFDVKLGTPFHWALSIARNRSIDRLRSRQRRARLLDELRVETGPESDRPDPAPLAGLGLDDVSTVRSAVKRLPADQRQAIEMAFFGGLTHGEIAAALKEPLGTIKARIRRGMLKLRDDLKSFL
jgi:RNA polymerase sigma-70 factor (ECF subfamily)